METPKEYTIIVRNISFVFFDDQIHRDYPNYFTNYFEGPFKESQDGVRVMRLNRDPYLFTFIHLYLSGYDVLPLPKGNIPHYLSEESRLKNLLLDAHFYGLDTLAKELEVLVRPTKCGGKSEEVQVAKETWKVLFVLISTLDTAPMMLIYDPTIANSAPEITHGPI